MNATSALVLIMILAFAVDRIGKAVLFALGQIPWWARRFPDPAGIADKAAAAKARRRGVIAYSALVGSMAAAAAWFFPETRLVSMLIIGDSHIVIDMIVTVTVLMGGSDLVGRVIQFAGMFDEDGEGGGGRAPRAGRDGPIEVVGRVTLDDHGRPAGLRAADAA